MKYSNICRGKFIGRPNRFVAYVDIDGVKEKVHVKNTGRCKELLIPEANVYLEDFKDRMGKRSLRYSLISVEKGNIIVNMDSQAPNKVVKEAFEDGRIRLENLKDITCIKSEYKYGDSRLDFYLEDSEGKKALAEVKGVTLEENGTAMFPDAPTLRGVRHIDELIKAKQEGWEAVIIFVIQMKSVKCMIPNRKTHPEFADALCRARQAGVEILAYNCIVSPEILEIDEKIPVKL